MLLFMLHILIWYLHNLSREYVCIVIFRANYDTIVVDLEKCLIEHSSMSIYIRSSKHNSQL